MNCSALSTQALGLRWTRRVALNTAVLAVLLEAQEQGRNDERSWSAFGRLQGMPGAKQGENEEAAEDQEGLTLFKEMGQWRRGRTAP